MRASLGGLALLCGALIAGLAAAKSSGKPGVLPHRRAGLWEQQVASGDGGLAGPLTQICLDRRTERRVALVSAQMNHAHCSEDRVTQDPDGAWSFQSVCGLDEGGSIATTGRASGDFKTAYRIVETAVTTGAATPAMNATRSFTIEAKWRGPCPAGMKAGDAVIGGQTVHVLSGLPR